MGGPAVDDEGYMTLPWMFRASTVSSIMQRAHDMGIQPHEYTDSILSGHVEASQEKQSEAADDQMDSPPDLLTIFNPLRVSEIQWKSLSPSPKQSSEEVIRPQISRLAPALVNLRVLAAHLTEKIEGPPLDVLHDSCTSTGMNIRGFLKSDDGESLERATPQKLSSGFPRSSVEGVPSEKIKKSIERFCALYVGNVRKSNGRGVGLPWELGWINIDPEPPHQVTLTEDGIAIAQEPFPFIDHSELDGVILPQGVTDVILRQIATSMPMEDRNIRIIVDAIEYGGATNSELLLFYTNQMEGELTARSGVPLMRADVEEQGKSIISSTLNRMEEMGLVRRERLSKEQQNAQRPAFLHTGTTTDRIRYHLTPYGREKLSEDEE